MSDRTTAHPLVIGFPGVLAQSLITHRLRHSTDAVTALVPSDAEAEWTAFIDELTAAQRARVRALTGRLEAEDLGLTGPQISNVLAECTHVVHADLTTEGNRDTLWRLHVKPLRGLMRIARDMKQLERLTIISTAFVSGDRTGVIYEEDLDRGQGFRSPFEWSMCQAERMAREMMPWIPITVLRPSAILNTEVQGAARDLDLGPRYLLDLMVRLPQEIPVVLPGGARLPLNLVPLAYVVQSIWALTMAPEARGRTFHITDPNPMSAQQVFEILSDVTHRPRPVTTPGLPGVMQKFMSLPGLPAAARNPRALLSSLGREVVYNCAGALDLLTLEGIPCPPFESFVDDLCAWAADAR